MTDARGAYNRRISKKGGGAGLEVLVPPVVPLRKVSGQLDDPFGEKSFYKLLVPPPFRFTEFLNYYYENTWNNACINIKANLVCGKFKLVPDEEDKKEDAEYNKLMDFLETPNESGDEDFLDICNKLWVDQEDLGNSYLEVVRDGGGMLKEIYHAPAHTLAKAKDKRGFFHKRLKQIWSGVSNKKDDKNMIYFRRWNDKLDRERQYNEVIQIKNYFPGSSYYGLPDYVPALGAMSLDKNAIIFNNAFFVNGGMLGQLLTVKNATLTPEQKHELRRFVQYNFTGVDNAHRMAILDALPNGAEVKVEKVMESIKDMSFERLRKFDRDEIIAAHRVPPKMLNISEPGRLGESKDGYNQMKMFKLFEIDPSQRKLENVLNRLFKIELGITGWRIKFDELDIRDPKDMNEELYGDIDHGIITVDEAREQRGLEPIQPEGIEVNEEGVKEVAATLNLSGIQIASATKIVGLVSSGEIPRDSGKNQLMIFFNLTDEQAEALLGAAGTGKKLKPDKKSAPGTPPVQKSEDDLDIILENLTKYHKKLIKSMESF
jgi:PBSX family phage portal protein